MDNNQPTIGAADIKAAVEAINAKAAKYKRYYDYYKGAHTWNFSSKKFKDKYGQRLQTLRENLCRTVVKAPAARLKVINFLADRADTENPAWKIWKQNNMPKNAGKIHREAFKTGEAFLIVWPDKNGKARFHVQTSANCHVWKNGDNGEIEKAAKLWYGSDKRVYLTLYYPDRIEKYISKDKSESGVVDAGAFVPRRVESESFPIENPYKRVPVFHFTFDEEADDQPNSILEDVIPLNDALNKSLADIFVAQEYNSMRQRHIAGIRVEQDEETGKKIEPFKPDDATWIAEDSEVKFGEFTDADLEKMLKVKAETVKAICLVSGIPPSQFNLEEAGQAISGEALRKIEARFTSLVEDSQHSFGEPWGQAVSFSLEIEKEKTENLEIETQWTDASPISESEILDNSLKKKNLGWSLEQLQRDYGLSEAQIIKMAEENAARRAAEMESQAKFFDGGGSLA